MKAILCEGPRRIKLKEMPDPRAEKGEVIIEPKAVGICGSDIHAYKGESHRRKFPVIMGHEAVGQVIELGRGTSTKWLGKHVVLQPILYCGFCDQCRLGYIQRCRKRRFIGGNVNGAMAQKLAVPINNLLPLPDKMDILAGVLTEPLAVVLHAVKKAKNLRGKVVLICGSGPIGLLMLLMSKRIGARYVITTDVNPFRREVAKKLGADLVIDPSRENWSKDLYQFGGTEHIDIAFDTVGIPSTFEQAISSVKTGGCVIALGGWRAVAINLEKVVTHEILVEGSFNYLLEEFKQSLSFLAENKFNYRLIITHTFPMIEAAEVFERLDRSVQDSVKVVLTQEVAV